MGECNVLKKCGCKETKVWLAANVWLHCVAASASASAAVSSSATSAAAASATEEATAVSLQTQQTQQQIIRSSSSHTILNRLEKVWLAAK
jgi:hypothetical protein